MICWNVSQLPREWQKGVISTGDIVVAGGVVDKGQSSAGGTALPRVLLPRAETPMAVLLSPVVLLKRALTPLAVLLLPVVLLERALSGSGGLVFCYFGGSRFCLFKCNSASCVVHATNRPEAARSLNSQSDRQGRAGPKSGVEPSSPIIV
jgi:hypothetical protein